MNVILSTKWTNQITIRKRKCEIWACFDKHIILAISGFIFVNFKRKFGSSSSFDLYLVLIASLAEKPVSHRYDVLNGIKKCKRL